MKEDLGFGGKRFERALVYAARGHRGQLRKGSQVPYISHLLAVSALVIEDGGDEDEAIAALLHDVVEDQGGASRLADVRREFGGRVAELVSACSDTDETPKPPWRERKERYLVHLEAADPSVLRVSLADKVHNAESLLLDYRELWEELWSRFNADSDQLWYYRSLADVFARRSGSRLVGELERAVSELELLHREREEQAWPKQLKLPPGLPDTSPDAVNKALREGIPIKNWIRMGDFYMTEYDEPEDVRFDHGGNFPRQMHEFPPELQDPKLSDQNVRPPAAGPRFPVIRLDADSENADWIKAGAWDLSCQTPGELYDYLRQVGMTVEQFKTLTVYTANVERMPWLKEI